MLAKIATADSASTVIKSTAFLYIAKRNHTLSTLYINTRGNFVFYSIYIYWFIYFDSRWFAEKQVKKEKSKAKQDKIKEVVKKLRAFAEAKNISLEENSSSMKERKKKVVCKTFHGAGLVVPVDENDVGYREVPETAGTIMHLYSQFSYAGSKPGYRNWVPKIGNC